MDSDHAMIKLISSEGHEFIVEKNVANASATIKVMLESSFAESKQGEIRFQEISGLILEKVIQYLYFKVRYGNTNEKIPVFDIPPELALELLMASNYLDC